MHLRLDAVAGDVAHFTVLALTPARERVGLTVCEAVHMDEQIDRRGRFEPLRHERDGPMPGRLRGEMLGPGLLLLEAGTRLFVAMPELVDGHTEDVLHGAGLHVPTLAALVGVLPPPDISGLPLHGGRVERRASGAAPPHGPTAQQAHHGAVACESLECEEPEIAFFDRPAARRS